MFEAGSPLVSNQVPLLVAQVDAGDDPGPSLLSLLSTVPLLSG